jgi:hypothetical protein
MRKKFYPMQLINIFSLTIFLSLNITTSANIPNEHSAIESAYDFSENQNERITSFVNLDIARSSLLLNDNARNIEKIYKLICKSKIQSRYKKSKIILEALYDKISFIR